MWTSSNSWGPEWNKTASSLPLSLFAHEHSNFWLLRRDARTYMSGPLGLRPLALSYIISPPQFSALTLGLSNKPGFACSLAYREQTVGLHLLMV